MVLQTSGIQLSKQMDSGMSLAGVMHNLRVLKWVAGSQVEHLTACKTMNIWTAESCPRNKPYEVHFSLSWVWPEQG